MIKINLLKEVWTDPDGIEFHGTKEEFIKHVSKQVVEKISTLIKGENNVYGN